jgi:hypothetical protein
VGVMAGRGGYPDDIHCLANWCIHRANLSGGG